MTKKILIVDDDTNLLERVRRQLRRDFEVDFAEGRLEALKLVQTEGPYAVVVSDMQMPGMNGVEFLSEVNQQCPETVRIMLTGNADQETAVNAVNEGSIFRFLNKPCDKERLGKTLTDALEHYRLITAERELVSKTLTGSIRVLTDILSIVNPKAFNRSSRVKRLVNKILDRLRIHDRWQFEIAAMLAPIGFITLEEELIGKIVNGEELSSGEQESVDLHPRLASELISNIPRLEKVAEIVGLQECRYDGEGAENKEHTEQGIPLGSRLLKIAGDYDQLIQLGKSPDFALDAMIHRDGCYDPKLLSILTEIIEDEIDYVEKEITFAELKPGALLSEHLTDEDGAILLSKGQELSESMLTRLTRYSESRTICEPIKITIAIKKQTASA